MKTIISLEDWPRREHFEFFNAHDEPFHGVVAPVDCTRAYAWAQDRGVSFYQTYLHCSLQVVNNIEALRYRIEGEQVVCYHTIHAGTTIPGEGGLFKMAFIPFDPIFDRFAERYTLLEQRLKHIKGLNYDENARRLDLVHYSCLPWVSFTGLTHARNFKYKDSVPKITFGKCQQDRDKLMMPVAINLHHGLADGVTLGEFFDSFQELLDKL